MLAMAQLMFGPPPKTSFDRVPAREEIKFFEDNGFLAVDRLTSDEEVAWMRNIFKFIFSPENAKSVSAPVDRSGTAKPGEEKRLTQAFFPEIQFPELLETSFRRNARRYAAALLSVEESRLTCWGHMIRKLPGARAASWHQDHAYWWPEFDYCALGVWLPMHDVTVEMGAMQFIPGSHKKGLLRHRQEDHPSHNVLIVDEPIDASKAVACPLKMGGATFHHSETLHYTAPNTTNQPRLAFPMEFQLTPVRRKEPKRMPWVDEHRAAVGTRPIVHVADGKVVHV
jgi:ectoine hydroxylase-related dioxygenase (phytanoyl-CoA dioxygenase family)